MEAIMKRDLVGKALMKFASALALAAVLLFVPAGTVHYPNGWLLLCLLFTPMAITGIVLMCTNPALLERRLASKEDQREQKAVTWIGSLVFFLGFVSAGLDFRFQWIPLPSWVVWAASFLFLGGYGLWAAVLRENEYLSRTVHVESAQTLIDTGLYAIVRHPMYSASIIIFLSMPLILGSVVSFVIFLAYPVLMVKRIAGEEEILSRELAGYTEYTQRVRYRLIPFVW
jgi:protein-S-isoprenylcysteine O-methyltransferase Ste14